MWPCWRGKRASHRSTSRRSRTTCAKCSRNSANSGARRSIRTSSTRATALRRRHHRGADDDHRVGERVLALQPGVPHPIARVLEAMTDQPHGLARGLTNYGDADFSLYLRRSFAKSSGYSRAMLARPVIGIAQPRTNHFLGEVWLNEGG